MRVLIVEDEVVLADAIARGLRRESMAVDIVYDGDGALERLGVNDYDVVILDRDLPGTHGDEVCRRLATGADDQPRVLMLTAAAEISARVEGLGLGADDYLAKPFAFVELVARIRALGRRARPAAPPVLVRAAITLDPARREVSRGGQPVVLSRKEFAVLEELMRADGAVVSTEEQLEKAWDENIDPFTKVVRVTVIDVAKEARRTADHQDRHRNGLPDPMSGLQRLSLRTRLTLWYGGLFFLAGLVITIATYFITQNSLNQGDFRIAARQSEAPGDRVDVIAFRDENGDPVTVGEALEFVAQREEQRRDDALRTLLQLSGFALGLAGVGAVGLGWLMAGRVLRPINDITATAKRVRRARIAACTRGSRSTVRATSCGSSPTRSTTCSSGSTSRSPASAASSTAPRTSCAPRWRSTVRCWGSRSTTRRPRELYHPRARRRDHSRAQAGRRLAGAGTATGTGRDR